MDFKYLSIFYQYLNQFKVDKGIKDYTHISMGNPAGCYKIPEENLDEFYHYYTKSIMDGEYPHLIEKHLEISPILIDLDLKYPNDEVYLHQKNYNETFIKEICGLYNKWITYFLKVDNIQFYILEKETLPKLAKGCIKEGIHIICNDVWTTADFQYVLRNKVLDDITGILNTQNNTEISKIPVINKWEDIIDESVIERNGWMMYGSCKPSNDEEVPYKLTKIIQGNEFKDAKEIKRLNLSKNIIELIKTLSIRKYTTPNEYRNTLLEDEAREYYQKNVLGIVETIQQKPVLSNKYRKRLQFTYNEIEQLVNLLSEERANSYKDWIEVGWCLHNICRDSLLDLWILFSKKSNKFQEGVCEKLWEKMKDEGLFIGSLIMWAKKDNPDGFKKWQKNDITQLILNSLNNFTHTTIAEILFRKYGHEFICSSQKYKTWHRFENHRWIETDEGVDLRTKISRELVADYLDILKMYQPSDLNEYANVNIKKKKSNLHNELLAQYQKCECEKCLNNDNLSTIDENNKKIIDSIRNLTKNLQTKKFKDDVMSECREIFYDKNFLKNLDNCETNEFLIGFENGVYDLLNYEFREGRPEDYISKNTCINYFNYDDDDPVYLELLDFINKVLPVPEMREYVLKLLASYLEGITPEEKFHIFTGSGSNGKSKLLELFQIAFGEYTVIFPIEMITQKRGKSSQASPELVRSKGCRAGVFQEPGPDEKIQVGFMKELTGGDKIVARDLYKPVIEFKPRFKLLLTCNNLPNIPSNDEGTWRRLRVVEFKSKFVDPDEYSSDIPFCFLKDKTIPMKIRKWKEAFMFLLIKYYKKYKEEGIKEPDDVLEYTKMYQEKCNIYLQYINERLTITDNPDEFSTVNDIFEDFKVWAKNLYDMTVKSKDIKDYFENKRKDLISKTNKKSYLIKAYLLNQNEN